MIEFESPIGKEPEVLENIGEITFMTNRVYVLFGNSKTGKTWLSVWLTRKITNKGEKVLYIDTEGKAQKWFKKHYDNDLIENKDDILYKTAKSLDEFRELIDDLDNIINNKEPIAIIVDTIFSPYIKFEHPGTRAQEIRKEVKRIKDLCLNNNIMGLITTRRRQNEDKAKGGKTIYHDTHHQIKIEEFEDIDKNELGEEEFMSKLRELTLDRNTKELITITKEGGLKVK